MEKRFQKIRFFWKSGFLHIMIKITEAQVIVNSHNEATEKYEESVRKMIDESNEKNI